MRDIDLNGVWTVLSTTLPSSGIEVFPTGLTLPAGDVLAGVDSENQRHLLLPLLPGEAARTDRRGRGVHTARINHDGTAYLTIFCRLPELHSVFTQFCRELLLAIAQASSPAKEAALALDRWRTLFSEAERPGLLSESALVGLLGELLIIERLLRLGAPGDLHFWVGPSNAVHDIRTSSHAIEVKATLVREGRVISISSIDQLEAPTGAELTLVHSSLKREPNGFNLPETLEQLKNAGAHQSAIESRLSELGLRPRELDQYSSRRYELMSTHGYDVATPAFPRLLRSSFQEGQVPAGVLRISYSIDLTNEPPSPLGTDEMNAKLSALATEAASAVDS